MKGRIFAFSNEIKGSDLRRLRKKLQLTQSEFARLANVSGKTIERWESTEKAVTGPVVTLARLLEEYPNTVEAFSVPQRIYPMRLWYMCDDDICAVIDVDERRRLVKVYNYARDYIRRPFGRNESPSFEEYETFLESRCFPRGRDKMKLLLKELDLPFYEPLMIIEKTQGRMAEDNFWIRIER